MSDQNPYESPQVHSTDSNTNSDDFHEEENVELGVLDETEVDYPKVKLGLSLVYWGLCCALVTIILSMFFQVVFSLVRMTTFDSIPPFWVGISLLVPGLLAVTAGLTGFVGQCYCLVMPPENPNEMVKASISCQVIAFLTTIAGRIALNMNPGTTNGFVAAFIFAGLISGAVGFLLFLIALKEFARFVNQRTQMWRVMVLAQNTLNIFLIVNLCILVFTIFPYFFVDESMQRAILAGGMMNGCIAIPLMIVALAGVYKYLIFLGLLLEGTDKIAGSLREDAHVAVATGNLVDGFDK